MDWDKLGIDYPLLNKETLKMLKTWKGISNFDRLSRLVAAKASGRSDGRMSWDDAYMDCLLYLAEHPDFADILLSMKLSHAANRLYLHAIYQDVRSSSDASVRGCRQDFTSEAGVKRGTTNYTEDEVAEMLVLHYCPSMVDSYTERTLDEDMPRAASNPAHSHTAWARLADLEKAWPKAGLTQRQEQCAFLVHVMGLPSTEAGRILGIDQAAAYRAADKAIEKITNAINGKDA